MLGTAAGEPEPEQEMDPAGFVGLGGMRCERLIECDVAKVTLGSLRSCWRKELALSALF